MNIYVSLFLQICVSVHFQGWGNWLNGVSDCQVFLWDLVQRFPSSQEGLLWSRNQEWPGGLTTLSVVSWWSKLVGATCQF